MSEVPFNLDDAIARLTRTPIVLSALLGSAPDRWMQATPSAEAWSPTEVLQHLIHGERTDWIPRARHILAGKQAPFAPFDRTGGHSAEDQGVDQLLATFADLRRTSLATLTEMQLTSEDLQRTGIHPELGAVRLEQLLATWVVHDLDHLAQITQSLAQEYATAIGPWRAYLPIVQA